MFYILRNTYSPNGASSNRAMAYYRAMDAIGVDATIVILQPDSKCSRIKDTFKHLKVIHCWNRISSSNRLFRRIYFYISIFRFLKKLRGGDKVYVYGSTPCLHQMIRKRGVESYLEVTEHPEVYPLKTRFFFNSLNKAFDDCKKLKGLFVISSTLKDCYCRAGVDEGKIHIINMIVDTTRFDGLVKTSGKKYLCYCGNGNNRKDKVDELIISFKKITESFPDVGFMIVGPTRQVYKGEKDNVELVNELGLKDRITFTGALPAEQIPQILVNAEILILRRPDTLQNRAGFATKLGEYLASATPVIASSVGDIPLFLKDGDSALLVPPDNQPAFENKLSWALCHPEEIQEIGRKGKEVAKQSFNSMVETKKLLSVIFGS